MLANKANNINNIHIRYECSMFGDTFSVRPFTITQPRVSNKKKHDHNAISNGYYSQMKTKKINAQPEKSVARELIPFMVFSEGEG